MASDLPPEIYDTSLLTTQKVINLHVTQEHKCLSEALYFEARGESKEGVFAVGNVILNRVKSDKHPNTICKVVQAPNQFSYLWDGKSDIPKNKKSYQRMQLISLDILKSQRNNKGALYYHNTTVDPYWNKSMELISVIDNHLFYKPKENGYNN